MEAHVKSIREILHSGDQFLVPFFQRHYSWRKNNWQQLLDDVTALTEEEETKHFLGPLVCTPFHPVPGEVTPYQLIDGQQRLMTITISLAALRDVARLEGFDEIAEEIHEDFLVHRRRQGLQRLKVVPRVGDRAYYEAVIEGNPPGTTESSGISGAYSFFKRHWKSRVPEGGETAIRRLLIALTSRLSLVAITITADQENPFEIFESLNATGLALEEADLIRNFLFMQVPLEEQHTFHNKHWEGFENLFDAHAPYEKLPPTLFYRSYLMRNGNYCRDKATYLEFKRQNLASGLKPLEQVTELRNFAKYELWLRRPLLCPVAELAKVFTEIQSLEITTAHPLILNLLHRHAQGMLDLDVIHGCFQDLASFVIRRAVCGESTRGYGKLFPEAIKVIRQHPRANLQDFWLGNRWPDDAAFLPALTEFPIYKRARAKCRLLLEKLEHFYEGNEQVKLEQLSIEHVMPQTLADGVDGDSWRQALGSAGWATLHEKWVHTIGNLTFTGYNSELSNGSFEEKQKAFAESSKLTLNEHFISANKWDSQAIESRGRQLARTVAQIWPRPVGGPPYIPLGPAPAEPDEAQQGNSEFGGHEGVRGRLRILIKWSQLGMARQDQTICERKWSATIARFVSELVRVFGNPMAQQLTEISVIRYPLSRNPAIDFRNAQTGVPYNHALVPGTDLYICLISSNPEKLRRLRTFLAKVKTPGGTPFPEGSVQVSVVEEPDIAELIA